MNINSKSLFKFKKNTLENYGVRGVRRSIFGQIPARIFGFMRNGRTVGFIAICKISHHEKQTEVIQELSWTFEGLGSSTSVFIIALISLKRVQYTAYTHSNLLTTLVGEERYHTAKQKLIS